jgi:SlyX protein
MEERLTDIEIQLMHQDNMIQELNQVVTGQQREIDRLTADVALLKEQLQLMSPSVQKDPADEEPPPHY